MMIKASIGGLFLTMALMLGGEPAVLPVQQMAPRTGDAAQSLIRFSETCDLPEQIGTPSEKILENGIEYVLRESSLEEVYVPQLRRAVEKEVLYQSVEALGEIPFTNSFTMKGMEKGPSYLVILTRDEIRTKEERWDFDFQFRVTFHSYGSGYYLLGSDAVVCDDSGPGLYGREAQLLALIGADSDSYRIDSCEWFGQPYEDENGVLCRDALAVGRKRVQDCMVRYKGTAKIPSYKRYRYKRIYERLWSEQEHTVNLPGKGSDEALTLRQKILKIMQTCLKVTVWLAGIFVLLVLFHLLRKLAVRIDEDRKKNRKNR